MTNPSLLPDDDEVHALYVYIPILIKMNGPQPTAVSRKELWQKQKQKEFLIIL